MFVDRFSHKLLFVALVWSGLTLGCASYSILDQNKTWMDEAGRHFENRNLVMVSAEKSPSEAVAKFKAEAKGLEDLANECSFVPRGTHIEEEITQKTKDQFIVFAKLVIDHSICEEAKKSLKFSEIESLANLGYTEQILKNQSQNPEPNNSKISSMSPKQKVERILSSDESNVVGDDGDFFMERQQIAFLKEAILLSSRGLYPKKLVISDKMTAVLAQKIQAVQSYEAANPALKSSSVTWSFAKERITQNLKASASERRQAEFSKKHHKDRRPAQKKTAEQSEN